MENLILEQYPNPVGVAKNEDLPRPAVVYLPRYVPQKNRSVRFSRWNVFLRDEYRCQYCGIQCGYGDNLPQPELEHVIPKSASGPPHFENTTTACHSCNSRKGSLSEKEFADRFGLKLTTRPERPKSLHPARFLRYITDANIGLWLKSEEVYIPGAKFFAGVMRLRPSIRQRILAHFEEINDEV